MSANIMCGEETCGCSGWIHALKRPGAKACKRMIYFVFLCVYPSEEQIPTATVVHVLQTARPVDRHMGLFPAQLLRPLSAEGPLPFVPALRLNKLKD